MDNAKRKKSLDAMEINEPIKEQVKTAMDEVDFTSGFETQYANEYRPLRELNIPPPDPELAWYRDFNTILMVIFLVATLAIGSILLIKLIFTTNPWIVFALTMFYLVIAIIVIYMEIKSKYVR